MKTIVLSFKMLIKHILRDGMLYVICIAPVFIVGLVDWILPQFIASILPFDIKPYYLLLDLFIAVLIPYLFCFASSMAILEEIDENISPYLSVTPLGKQGYLISRLILPAAISAVITFFILFFGSLTNLSVLEALLLSVFMALISIISSMLVVVFAKNKVEGMAISKMSGLSMLGLFIPFFIHNNIQYFFGFMPTFWIAKFAITKDYLYILPITICIGIGGRVLFNWYQSKIEI